MGTYLQGWFILAIHMGVVLLRGWGGRCGTIKGSGEEVGLPVGGGAKQIPPHAGLLPLNTDTTQNPSC
jgi:hypothetical protein